MEGQQQELSQGTKILFYVLSFFIPLAGIIIGVLYIQRPDEESRQLGRTCMYIALGAVVLICLVNVVLFLAGVAVFGLVSLSMLMVALA
jgi:hypothetical protein